MAVATAVAYTAEGDATTVANMHARYDGLTGDIAATCIATTIDPTTTIPTIILTITGTGSTWSFAFNERGGSLYLERGGLMQSGRLALTGLGESIVSSE
jgi:hypothetical protein